MEPIQQTDNLSLHSSLAIWTKVHMYNTEVHRRGLVEKLIFAHLVKKLLALDAKINLC